VIRAEAYGEVTFFRLARGVLGWPFYWGGAYLAGGVLVDGGPPATARELLAHLAGRPLEALLVTHHHEDHWGAGPLLRRERGVPVLAPAPAVALLARGFPIEGYRRLAWGRPEPVAAEALPAELRVSGLRFQSVATPGHGPDHVCLLEPERGWLFTGDLFLAERLRYLRADEDLDAMIASLRGAARLPARDVFCSHRGRVRGGVAALARKAEILEELRGRARELLRQGLAEGEVARRLVGREGLMTWFSRGHFSAVNFVRAAAGPDGAGPGS
jgi:glyoxylase-like metal-dependent hydrolase (beta-lactamase superfamily II)